MKKNTDVTTVQITLRGMGDIMFDRYAGDNKTQLRVDQKMYLASHLEQLKDNTIYLPSLNIISLLSAQNTPSAPKRFLDSRKYKSVTQAILSYTAIEPQRIPFLRAGKPIVFTGLDANERDKKAGVYVHRAVARLDKGIPNPKERPVLQAPWSLEFALSYFQNGEVTLEQIQNLLIKAGVAIGLGTFRGVFGKFKVEKWN